MRGGRIFISYRRDDSRADSGRLYDKLSVSFPGRVFRDIASIEPGVEWDEAIARVISETVACIVVIGKNWLNAMDDQGNRRLDDEHDTVRQEIAAVLRRNMRVFPVLVGGARMPAEAELPLDLQPLCRRHAMELSEQYWDDGVERLIQAVKTVLSPESQTARTSERARVPPKAGGVPTWAFAALAAVVLIGGGWWYWSHREASVTGLAVVGAGSSTAGAGNWRAVVITPAGQRTDEDLELYPDHSFRFIADNATVGLGKWQYEEGAGLMEVTSAINLQDHSHYSCTWKSIGGARDSLSGNCKDQSSNMWTVSLSSAPGDAASRSYNIPRVNLSDLTTAERAGFAVTLASERCRCGMTVLTCLRKHPACQYKQGLAQTALQSFLQTARQ